MIKVLVVHDILHEAKKIEHYITSYYGACSVLLFAGADKNEIMDIIENEDNEIDPSKFDELIECIGYPDRSKATF